MVPVCVVASVDNAKCADCIGVSVPLSRWVSETYNMLISNSNLQWVLLSVWYCSCYLVLGYCLNCWVLVMLSTVEYEHSPFWFVLATLAAEGFLSCWLLSPILRTVRISEWRSLLPPRSQLFYKKCSPSFRHLLCAILARDTLSSYLHALHLSPRSRCTVHSIGVSFQQLLQELLQKKNNYLISGEVLMCSSFSEVKTYVFGSSLSAEPVKFLLRRSFSAPRLETPSDIIIWKF